MSDQWVIDQSGNRVLRIPMWGYEALMRPAFSQSSMLRIPMWGYEMSLTVTPPCVSIVTNPHVGL